MYLCFHLQNNYDMIFCMLSDKIPNKRLAKVAAVERYGKTRAASYELLVTSWKLKSMSWNSKVRVQIHEFKNQLV